MTSGNLLVKQKLKALNTGPSILSHDFIIPSRIGIAIRVLQVCARNNTNAQNKLIENPGRSALL